jgi:hypothetical protein
VLREYAINVHFCQASKVCLTAARASNVACRAMCLILSITATILVYSSLSSGGTDLVVPVSALPHC